MPEVGTEHEEQVEHEVTAWMWAPGLACIVVAGCLLMRSLFGMSSAETILALLMAFVLSLVAIQATGATDTTPLTAVSKVSQVVLGGVTKAAAVPSESASQRLSLLGGALTNIGAGQACDLMGDFRVGFLLKTPARFQYAAQIAGTLVASLVAPGVFFLLSAAYPCILEGADGALREGNAPAMACEFQAPSVAAWRAVAVAASRPDIPAPRASLLFAIAMAGIGCSSVLIRQHLCVGRWQHMRVYQPNMMIVGLAFTLPSPKFGTAMLIGALIAWWWRTRHREGFRMYMAPIAAGMVAGEGIGGIINGALEVAGLGGHQWGQSWGCPAGIC